MHILTILGSLRNGSFNGMTLKIATELAPTEMIFEAGDISQFPPYNQDMENAGVPEVVKKFKDQIRASDGLLFVTPEYNYSMPGVLKNAIDWASRPPKENPFSGKPCAVMSASTGVGGGAKAQYHFRQSCVFVNLFCMNRPEVIIPRAMEKFDANGSLTDDATQKIITSFMHAFQEWVLRFTK